VTNADVIVPLLRRLRFVLPMLAALGLLVLLRTDGRDVLFRFAGLDLTREALAAAGDTVLRLLLIACASLLFTLLVPLSHAVHGLRRLRLPHSVIAVAWLTERFLMLLTSDLKRMSDGIRARSAALSLSRRVLLGARISGSFLVRAVGRSERLADAMTARGFDGRIPLSPDARWTPRDSAVGLAALSTIILALLL
jgi:cobalt/nickel transport system permease protein